MGLKDTIKTLEVRMEAGQDVVQELAESYARMARHKASQRLFWGWFDDLAALLKAEGRYDELIDAADGVDPGRIGWREAQHAVESWLDRQSV